MSSDIDLRLSHYLLKVGCLDAHAVQVAQSIADKRREPLSRVLHAMEWVKPDVLQQHMLNALGFALIDLDRRTVDRAMSLRVGEAFCRQHSVVLLVADADIDVADVVLLDPDDIVVVDALRQRIGSSPVRLCMADTAAIERAHHRAFVDEAGADGEELEPGAVGLLLQLLVAAVTCSASDIHIEPTRDCARLRFRCDGVLRLWRYIKTEDWQPLLGRIKVLAGLDIADSRSSQDGRFSHAANGREVDIRVSVMPTDRGESVVLRMLDRNRHALSFDALGIDPEQQQQLLSLLRRPEGMVLVCGPTGSGKSTTLYALVESLRGESLNIITLEDPVEYPSTWVRQTSINDAVSMDYAEGVRAALRQDPDVMLIGEMRDAETAQVSLRAAMTGHRVLTTVHANSAMASVGRLWDLGLQPSLVAGNLIGVVAQRLLRRLCQHCKMTDPVRPGYCIAVGCSECHQQGYLGRHPVFEIWQVDEDFDELLHQSASRRAFEKLSQEKGGRSLQQAAVALMESGVTSAEEVERVIGPVPTGGCSE